MRQMPMITGIKLMAFMKKQITMPKFAMIMPETAGPTMRARLNTVEFRETAFMTFSGPTRSIKKDCLAGTSSVCTSPKMVLSRRMCQYCISPVKVSTVITTACSINIVWVTIMIFFFEKRSTRTPAKSENRSIGMNWHMLTIPTFMGEFVTV
jgi:hypothetical protein